MMERLGEGENRRLGDKDKRQETRDKRLNSIRPLDIKTTLTT